MQSNCTINYSFMEGNQRELLIAPMTSQPWWSNMTSSSLICSACFFGCVCVAVVVVGAGGGQAHGGRGRGAEGVGEFRPGALALL